MHVGSDISNTKFLTRCSNQPRKRFYSSFWGLRGPHRQTYPVAQERCQSREEKRDTPKNRADSFTNAHRTPESSHAMCDATKIVTPSTGSCLIEGNTRGPSVRQVVEHRMPLKRRTRRQKKRAATRNKLPSASRATSKGIAHITGKTQRLAVATSPSIQDLVPGKFKYLCATRVKHRTTLQTPHGTNLKKNSSSSYTTQPKNKHPSVHKLQ